MNKENIDITNEERAKLVISELIKSSVRHFLIAPGSRSTPLTLAVAQNPLAESVVHFDERGLAFHGLGIAKSTGLPVCLICTSGTALMNFYPAVVEASKAMIPLIIISADRPPELRDTGANQAIDQIKPFSNFCRWEFDLAFQDLLISNDMIATTINQAVYRSISNTPGPVLLNCMIREPFTSKTNPKTFNLQDSPLPKTKYYTNTKSTSNEEYSYLASELSQYEKGLIIVGNSPLNLQEESFFSFAMKLQWPIFADPLSNLRHIGRDSTMITYYNYILENTPSNEKMIPEVVVHLGGHIVSKKLIEWIESIKLKKYVHIANFPHRHDPLHIVTDRIEMDPNHFCNQINLVLKGNPPNLWLSRWKEYSLEVEEILTETFQKNTVLSEQFAVQSIEERVLKESSFFFANSLSIRYADSLFFPREKLGNLYGNRGASGIDGLIATSIGIARGTKKRVLCILGDLAFLHDINSLALLEKYSLPITFLVLNNSGGGIFHYLSISEKKDHFEKFFETKHSLSIKCLAEAFNIDYHCPKEQIEYLDILEEFTKVQTPNIIEVKTSGKENFQFQQQIEQNLRKKLSKNKKEKGIYAFFGK